MTEEPFLTTFSHFMNPLFLQIGTSVSVVMVIASVAVTPAILARLPADYFLHERPHLLELLRQGPLSKCLIIVAKNIIGTLLLLLGFILIFLPGQGLLTIMVGLLLLDFPRKKQIMRGIATRPAITRSLNWLRERRGKPPLLF